MLKIFAYVNLRLVTDRSTGPQEISQKSDKKAVTYKLNAHL